MKKILLIEDYNLQSYLMEEVLNKKYEIKSIDNPLNAKRLISLYKPDLVILDIVMPNKTGIEILEEINSDVKVIVVSSIPSKYISERVKNLGAKFYLEKPINLSFFKDIIDEELRYVC